MSGDSYPCESVSIRGQDRAFVALGESEIVASPNIPAGFHHSGCNELIFHDFVAIHRKAPQRFSTVLLCGNIQQPLAA